VNGLYVDPSAAPRFERNLPEFLPVAKRPLTISPTAVANLLSELPLAVNWNVLAHQLSRIALSKRTTCDFTLNNLRDALMEVVANFPVYRTYVAPSGVSDNDAEYIHRAMPWQRREVQLLTLVCSISSGKCF